MSRLGIHHPFAHGVRLPLLLALVALLLAGAARPVLGATDPNLAPNPKFEFQCGGSPCNWSTGGSPGTVGSSTTAHSGAASLSLGTSSLASGDTGTAESTCIALSVSGPYELSIWYNTRGAQLQGRLGDSLQLSAALFTDAACTSSVTGRWSLAASIQPVPDSDWHQLSGAIDAPAGSGSALIGLNIDGDSGAIVLFDDAVFMPEPEIPSGPIQSPLVLSPAPTSLPVLPAVNLAPNGGFEQGCGASGTAACGWSVITGAGSATLGSDSHGGARDLEMSIATSTAIGALNVGSGCIGGVGAGTAPLSIWYKAQQGWVRLELGVTAYSTPDCSGAALPSPWPLVNRAAPDGQWHQLGDTIALPAGTASVRLTISTQAHVGTTLQLDDVAFGPIFRALTPTLGPKP